jgi:indole-3-glycerol phosphate synthase
VTTARVATGTILDRILDRTAIDVAERKRSTPVGDLQRLARAAVKPVGLRDAISGPGVSVIAEIKRASPSRGMFPVHVDPAMIAAEYLAGGAAALSVLTDAPFFHGSLADLGVASDIAHGLPVPRPVLRKDFVIDPYQVVEARAHGADAVLLIVAALDDAALRALMEVAASYSLDALVEVHDERELERALRAGAILVGINNRNLESFKVDVGVTERLAWRVPSDVVLVGESGIFGPADVARLGAVGVRAVLVGEGLIIQPDRAAAVRSLLSQCS